MSILQNIQLLKRLHKYIKIKSTGVPKRFARRLGISESKLYRIIKELNDEGIVIKFDSLLGSYFYDSGLDIDSLFNGSTGK